MYREIGYCPSLNLPELPVCLVQQSQTGLVANSSPAVYYRLYHLGQVYLASLCLHLLIFKMKTVLILFS